MPTSTGAARTGAWVGAPLMANRRQPVCQILRTVRVLCGPYRHPARYGSQLNTRLATRMPGCGRTRVDWRMRFVRRRPIVSLLVLAALIAATTVEAQFRRGFNRGFGNVRLSTAADVDGSFQFCRIIFNGDFRGDDQGGSWNVDWPRADINLSIRLSELTKTTVGMRRRRRAQPPAAAAHRRGAVPVPVHHDDRGGVGLDQRGRGRASCATTC